MDLRDRTAMILSGSGLVGHALARRLLAAEPKRVVLVALYEDEVRRAADTLAPYRGRTTVDVEWGNVFLPAAEARLERAGILRRHALDRLQELERTSGDRSVAFEMLGPPRLTKLLFEAYLCGRLRPNVRALAASAAAALAEECHALVRADATLRQRILSVGIPILAPDGVRLYRGAHVVVPPAAGDPCAAAPRGWVDLRPEALGQWIRRAQAIVAQAEQRRPLAQESGSDVAWTAPGPDDPVSPARLATWIFAVEDQGERIKR